MRASNACRVNGSFLLVEKRWTSRRTTAKGIASGPSQGHALRWCVLLGCPKTRASRCLISPRLPFGQPCCQRSCSLGAWLPQHCSLSSSGNPCANGALHEQHSGAEIEKNTVSHLTKKPIQNPPLSEGGMRRTGLKSKANIITYLQNNKLPHLLREFCLNLPHTNGGEHVCSVKISSLFLTLDGPKSRRQDVCRRRNN